MPSVFGGSDLKTGPARRLAVLPVAGVPVHCFRDG